MDHDGLFASRYFGTSIVEIVRQEEHNIYRCVPKKGSPILEFWYVNASGHTYVEGTGENAVTKTRVNAFSDVHAPWKWKRSLREEAPNPPRGVATLRAARSQIQVSILV
jgi:hypothetical protein